MKKHHSIKFRIIRLFLWMRGIRPGKFVATFSDSKQRYIMGVLIEIGEFEIMKYECYSEKGKGLGAVLFIRWLDPIQGNHSYQYVNGWYPVSGWRKLRGDYKKNKPSVGYVVKVQQKDE